MINIPISISYHASGNKVNDVAGPVGLGWTLLAGGGLTRTVLGHKDENVEYGPFERSPWTTWQEFLDTAIAHENQYNWLYELYHSHLLNNWDYYSDRFYYNLGNGESGVFRKDFATGEFKSIPYKPIKVRFINQGGSSKIELTTIDGTRYIFNNNVSMFSEYWNPEKIINNTNTDSVLIYSHYDEVQTYGYSTSQVFGAYRNTPWMRTEPEIYNHPSGHCWNEMYISQKDWPESVTYKTSNAYDKVALIDSIVGVNTTIRFTYVHDREEVFYLSDPITHGSRLANIHVYKGQSNQVIKSVNLSHTYLGLGDEKRLLLSDVQSGANGEEKHEFKYNPEPLPPYYYGTQAPMCQQDLWGYKNGSYNSSLLFADFAPGGTNNLFPNEIRAQAGILQEIRYPTGGKSVFEYECHRVSRDFYGPGFLAANIPADGMAAMRRGHYCPVDTL